VLFADDKQILNRVGHSVNDRNCLSAFRCAMQRCLPARATIEQTTTSQWVRRWLECLRRCRAQRASLPLNFVVASPHDNRGNLDRWYVLGEAEGRQPCAIACESCVDAYRFRMGREGFVVPFVCTPCQGILPKDCRHSRQGEPA